MKAPGDGEPRSRSLTWHAWASSLLIGLSTLGCGTPRGGDEAATHDAYRALEAGRASLAQGRTAEARDAFQIAVRLGGLQPDFYCEAVALLGRCEVSLGNVQAAAEALSILEQGDADSHRVASLKKMVEERRASGHPKPPP